MCVMFAIVCQVTGVPPGQSRLSIGASGLWFVGKDDKLYKKDIVSPMPNVGAAMGAMGNLSASSIARTTRSAFVMRIC
jgi:hypothetical protein